MFYTELNKFDSLNPRKGRTLEKKTVYDNASELYNEYLEIYFNQYMTLSDAKKRTFGKKYDPENLFLEEHDYSLRSENKEESTDKEESIDFSDMPPQGGDEEEVREGKGIQILTPNKLLTRLKMLLAQIKAGNNSYKLKNEIRQILHLLYQYNGITKKVYNNLIKSIIIMEENIMMEVNMIVVRDPKPFCFNFDWPKDIDENFKHEIEFIIKKQ